MAVSERELCVTLQQNSIKEQPDYIEIDAIKTPAHATILQNFTDNILNGAELIAPGVDGINQLTLTNAAYLSSWKGCEIKLPFEVDEYDKYLDEHIKMSSLRQVDELYNDSNEYSDRWQVKW